MDLSRKTSCAQAGHTSAAAVLGALALVGMLALSGCSSGNAASSSASAAASSAAVSSASAEVSSEKNRDAKFEDIPADALITAEELHGMLEAAGDDAPFVLDVRAAGVARDAFIDGSKNIPAGRQLDVRLGEIPTDRTIAIISRSTDRTAEVRQTLIDAGFAPEQLLVVEDGMEAWVDAGYPTEHRASMGC